MYEYTLEYLFGFRARSKFVLDYFKCLKTKSCYNNLVLHWFHSDSIRWSPFAPLEDIPDKPERTHRASHDWGRVEVGVVRNAVPNIDMSDFKRELVHATKVVANELNDKQSRVTVRYRMISRFVIWLLSICRRLQFRFIICYSSMCGRGASLSLFSKQRNLCQKYVV